MKRKRSRGRSKPKLDPVAGEKEAFANSINGNNQVHLGLHGFEDSQFNSGAEAEAPKNSRTTSKNLANVLKQKVVDVAKGETKRLFTDMNFRSSENVSKKAGSRMTNLSKTFGSSNIKPSGNAEQVQCGRMHQQELNLIDQDSHKEQELKDALTVIRKVMEMDAAVPFNFPLDPIAIGVNDYFDLINAIDMPMDFATICSNLENGIKYKTSKDVLRDVQHIWDNCCKQNKEGHYIFKLMNRVKSHFMELWIGAGLYREEQDIDGFPLQDENFSGLQPCNNSFINNLSYQSQKKPYECQLSSGEQQTSGSHTGTNYENTEATVRQTLCGHSCLLDPMDDNSSQLQQKHTGVSNLHLQQNCPSLGYHQPYQPQQRSCKCQSSSQLPQPSHQKAGSFTVISGHSHLPPKESTTRQSLLRHKCLVGPAADDSTCLRPNHLGLNQLQCQLHWPSVNCCQPYPPQQGSCQCHPNSRQEQPSQQLAGAKFACAESMLRGTKCVPKFPVGPTTNFINCQKQDDMIPNQMQPWQGTCAGQLSCGIPQHSQLDAAMDMGSGDSSCIRRRKRGPTRCLNVWNRDGKIPITTDELGKPIGPEAPKLNNFLGTIARNGHIAPLNYVDWRALPDENKNKMWQQVLSKFDINSKSKSWVLKSIGKKWKDWKAELKASHYNPHETDEERLADRDERVLPDQWRILVSFWNSEEAKERSVKNKANRAQHKTNHTTGTKSLVRVCKEQTQLHQRAAKTQGTSQDDTVEVDIFQGQEQDMQGHLHKSGLVPAPSDLKGPKPSGSEAKRMVSQANAEVHEMKKKMEAMEQSWELMTAQMTSMMSMMLTMQRKFPGEHVANVVASPSEPLHPGQAAEICSSSTGP